MKAIKIKQHIINLDQVLFVNDYYRGDEWSEPYGIIFWFTPPNPGGSEEEGLEFYFKDAKDRNRIKDLVTLQMGA